MTLSSAALKTFAEDYRALSALSLQSTSYELGRASTLLRKFMWAEGGADLVRAALGLAGNTVIDVQQLAKQVAPATASRAHLIIPYLGVLPHPIVAYHAVPAQKGNTIAYDPALARAALDLRDYCSAPFVLIDGVWVSRREVVSHFAYEAGNVHLQLTQGSPAQQARIRAAGKLELPVNMVRDDMTFFWASTGDPQALMLLGNKYEIRDLLALQIANEIVTANSVTELVVEIDLQSITNRL